MDNERSQSWKGFTIETCVFPVCALPPAGRNVAVAIVRRRPADGRLDSIRTITGQAWTRQPEVEYAIRHQCGVFERQGLAGRFLV
jgi:hypothetical protein